MASGIKMSIDGDWDKFNDALQKAGNLNFEKIHKQMGEYMLKEVRMRFKHGEGPDGAKWPKSYRAKIQGGQTLRDTKRLQNSITYRAKRRGVEIGTNVKYAAVHQEGDTIKAKRKKYLRFKVGDRWYQKKEVTVPARPFLGINDENIEELKRILNEAIKEALK